MVFFKDENGQWWKREYKKQCPEKILFGRQCQGYEGHNGVHWCYQEEGTFEWNINRTESEAEQKNSLKKIGDYDYDNDIACGSIPPTHKRYVHPNKMNKHYYRVDSVLTEVVDPDEIERLENNEVPDRFYEDATVIRSLNIGDTPPVVQERYNKFLEDMKKKKKKNIFRRLINYVFSMGTN